MKQGCLKMKLASIEWGAFVFLPFTICINAATGKVNNFRLQFWRWLIHKTVNGPDISFCLLWIYEATFTNSGVNNLHNIHEWALGKPHDIWRPSFQQRFSVSVWSLIVDDYSTSSCVIVNHLDGIEYIYFIERMLLLLLEDVSLNYFRFKILTAATMNSTIFQKIVSLNVSEDMLFPHNHFSET
jgi:hypothetical protein